MPESATAGRPITARYTAYGRDARFQVGDAVYDHYWRQWWIAERAPHPGGGVVYLLTAVKPDA